MTLLMGIWSWWAFDIFTLITSYLSVEVISAQTIMRSLGLFTFMIPVGFKIACQFLIGSNIGKGDICAILHYYRVCMVSATFLGLVQVAILYFFRDEVIGIFTSDVGVQN